MSSENYVYKKEVDWSLLVEGLTLPIDNQVIFGQILGRFLKRGESKGITLYLNGQSYKAKIVNVNFDSRFNRKSDILQIRYSRNGDLAKALQACFYSSYQYISSMRKQRDPSDRRMIRLPDDKKEYLAIYTTEELIKSSKNRINQLSREKTDIDQDYEYFEMLESISKQIRRILADYIDIKKERIDIPIEKQYAMYDRKNRLYREYVNIVETEIREAEDKYSKYADEYSGSREPLRPLLRATHSAWQSRPEPAGVPMYRATPYNGFTATAEFIVRRTSKCPRNFKSYIICLKVNPRG